MDVDEILSSHKQKFKSTEVHREVQPTFDLGNLLISDLSNIDATRLRYDNISKWLNNLLIDLISSTENSWFCSAKAVKVRTA